MTTLTLDVFSLDELDEKVRARIVEREQVAAWESWAHWETDELLHEYANLALPGTDNLKVTAWSLHYYPGAVVECDVIDAARFTDALGVQLDDDDLENNRVMISVVPHHGRGSWPGESSVLVTRLTEDGDEDEDHDELSRALQETVMQVVRKVRDEMDAATSEEAITDGLLEARWLYLADGHRLDYVAD